MTDNTKCEGQYYMLEGEKPLNPAVAHILQFFECEHLPLHLQMISRPFRQLAHAIARGDNNPDSGTVTFGGPLPDNPEKTVTLRKLLEAKDAAVRTVLSVIEGNK